MATSEDILAVRDAIEPAPTGWEDAEIAERLDAGRSINRTIESYWRTRAQNYILVVSTSESGSTRGNDVIYNRMIGLADEYASRALTEEERARLAAEQVARGRVSSFRLRRV